MRISWLKFEPKISNFPTVIEILPSISITKAKKATFWGSSTNSVGESNLTPN